ncbi:MAG: TRAP transporter small permease [Pseudomonadota bacterium]
MSVLTAPLGLLAALNTAVLRLGRTLAWMALGLMVLVILIQVVFRYVPFLDALPWPEEAARFMMLWMTGLIAPSAYRWGGFVAIDMVPRMLPVRIGMVLNLAILAVSLLVLIQGVRLGWADLTGLGGRFDTAALWVPVHIDYAWQGMLLPTDINFVAEPTKIARKYMMASLTLGLFLMALVNVELILRSLIKLVNPDAPVDADPDMIIAGAD